MRKTKTFPVIGIAAALAAAPFMLAAPGVARASNMSCNMKFEMSGWSAVYKTANGHGTISCNNGETIRVLLESQGGGLTVGKSTIDNGSGNFTGVRRIGDVLGDYVAASGEAGAVKSGQGTVLTKGEVSLALGGTGRGWDAGVAFSSFKIKPMQASTTSESSDAIAPPSSNDASPKP